MTKEEREQRDLIRENERMQKQLADKAFRQKARFEALSTAQFLRPPTQYINEIEKGSLLTQRKAVTPSYDVTKEAEKIYQWLIKVLK